jgi:hypothetical protein
VRHAAQGFCGASVQFKISATLTPTLGPTPLIPQLSCFAEFVADSTTSPMVVGRELMFLEVARARSFLYRPGLT